MASPDLREAGDELERPMHNLGITRWRPGWRWGCRASASRCCSTRWRRLGVGAYVLWLLPAVAVNVVGGVGVVALFDYGQVHED